MERFSEHDGLAVALAELRPTPETEFAAELDALVAAGFPRRSRFRRFLPATQGERLGIPSPRRLAFAGGTIAVVAIAVATALIGSTNPGNPARMAIDQSSEGKPGGVQLSESLPSLPRAEAQSSNSVASAGLSDFNASLPMGRAIERSAQVTLLASPGDVADDSAEVFAAVHDAHGIVLRSHTTQGSSGRAGATFQLLIPSARLGDALAAISSIDEVGSRNDATTDITASTAAVGKQLHETQASIDSLVSQIAAAETDAEREALEIELRRERRHAGVLQTQLDRLHQRTHYSHVSVRIETGNSLRSNGPWGVDDAFHDAGHVLGIAAGVTLVGLAVLAPLALLALLAWLVHRTWLRIRRSQALS
jgi:hypothetical protein